MHFTMPLNIQASSSAAAACSTCGCSQYTITNSHVAGMVKFLKTDCLAQSAQNFVNSKHVVPQICKGIIMVNLLCSHAK